MLFTLKDIAAINKVWLEEAAPHTRTVHIESTRGATGRLEFFAAFEGETEASIGFRFDEVCGDWWLPIVGDDADESWFRTSRVERFHAP